MNRFPKEPDDASADEPLASLCYSPSAPVRPLDGLKVYLYVLALNVRQAPILPSYTGDCIGCGTERAAVSNDAP